jgi:hypothetical protein
MRQYDRRGSNLYVNAVSRWTFKVCTSARLSWLRMQTSNIHRDPHSGNVAPSGQRLVGMLDHVSGAMTSTCRAVVWSANKVESEFWAEPSRDRPLFRAGVSYCHPSCYQKKEKRASIEPHIAESTTVPTRRLILLSIMLLEQKIAMRASIKLARMLPKLLGESKGRSDRGFPALLSGKARGSRPASPRCPFTSASLLPLWRSI